MSFPNIPDVNSTIDITINESVNLIYASIAYEELGFAHIINSEAEKIQYVLGTLEGQTPPEPPPTIEDLLKINRSVEQTLRSVIKNQMLLQSKLEDTISITTTSTTTTTTTTKEPIDLGSAWSVGTSFGQGNAQYTTLGSTENEKTVVLGLGSTYIPVGTVHLLRSGNNLSVTFATVFPYIMNQVHLYVDDIAPTNSAPGSFPYQYTVTDPADYFTTHVFIVDVSAFAGETIYVAAHAHILEQQ